MIRILVVEDSFGTRLVYRLWCNSVFDRLGREGVIDEVSSKTAAEEKLAAVGDSPYHLALIDIAFPVEYQDDQGRTRLKLNSSAGLELCEMMGREHPQTPIIVASSSRIDRDAIDFLNDRTKCPTVCTFVIEPFSHERFLEIAEPILRKVE